MIIRYSQIDTYLQCKRKYKSKYIDNLQEQGNSSALAFGSALHLALKTQFEGEDPYSIFNMYWDSLKSGTLEYDRHSHQDLKELATEKFLPNFIRLHYKKFKNVKLEQTLEMPVLGSHSLQGTFDLLGEYEGIPTLVDWKTSAREYPLAKVYRNLQMYIYAALCKHNYGTLPEQIMYKVFIKNEGRIQTLKLKLTEDLLASRMKIVNEIIQDIAAEQTFYPNYNCYCITPELCFPGGNSDSKNK